MPKSYKQKSLGYKRATTKAMMRVEFSNGEEWDVPLQIIADDRDSNYVDDMEDTVKFVRAKNLDEYEFRDWFSNNMNWSDVVEYAVKVESKPIAFDYERDFCNVEKTVIGEI